MKAMLTNSYGPDAQMQLEEIPRPKVVLPDDILVQVVAGSVNPIDLKMIGGYGVKVMNMMRRNDKVCVWKDSKVTQYVVCSTGHSLWLKYPGVEDRGGFIVLRSVMRRAAEMGLKINLLV